MSEIVLPDLWSLYSGIWNDGLSILLKIRKLTEANILSGDYRERYVITWKITPTPDRLVSDKEADNMAQFESIIVPALEEGQLAIFVAAATHNRERDWIFYCRDSDEMHRRLNVTLQNESMKPIKVMSCKDPNWNEFKGINANIAKLTKVH
jgi:hypothetical protein